VDSVPLLADVARAANLKSPVLDGLAAVLAGRIEPQQWTETVTAPAHRERARSVRAA
jgi:hypothetical protein